MADICWLKDTRRYEDMGNLSTKQSDTRSSNDTRIQPDNLKLEYQKIVGYLGKWMSCRGGNWGLNAPLMPRERAGVNVCNICWTQCTKELSGLLPVVSSNCLSNCTTWSNNRRMWRMAMQNGTLYLSGRMGVLLIMKHKIIWGTSLKATAFHQCPMMHIISITFKHYFRSWEKYPEKPFWKAMQCFFLRGVKEPNFEMKLEIQRNKDNNTLIHSVKDIIKQEREVTKKV